MGETVEGKTVIVWGTGSAAETFMASHSGATHRVIDSDRKKWGQLFFGLAIESPDALDDIDPSKAVLFIASMFFPDILENAASYGFELNKNCFLATQLSHRHSVILRGYVDRRKINGFLQDLHEAETQPGAGFVVLRDFEAVVLGGRQSTVNLGDVNLLLEDGLSEFFLQQVSSTAAGNNDIVVDAQVHERFPASRLPDWFRPLATDLLAERVIRGGVPCLPRELEAHALAYHILFHKGPEAYIVNERGLSERLLRLAALYDFSAQDEEWPRLAEVRLRADGYWPPLDMRRTMLKSIEAQGGRAPWLRATCTSSRDDSDVHVVFVRSEDPSIMRAIESELKTLNLEPRRWFRCDENVCDRVRSGVWSEDGNALPARLALEVHGRLDAAEIVSSDQEFQTPHAFSLKYRVRTRLRREGMPTNLVHMPDDAAETLESIRPLEIYGHPT